MLSPVLRVDFIHRREILHIREKHVDLDDILNRGARGLEHGCEVLDAAVLFCFESVLIVRCSW